MIRTVIIDDELAGVNSLQVVLDSYCPDVTVVEKAHNVLQGIKVINKHKPDLVFLDIQMPGGSGFDILESLDNKDFHVVFVTAHDKHAIKAFEYSAVHYILKPPSAELVKMAVDRVARQLSSNEPVRNQHIQILQDNYAKPGYHQEKIIVLNTSETTEYVHLKDIISIEAGGSYSTFYIEDCEPVIVSKNLREYDQVLNDLPFFRSHNSHIVNLQKVRRFIRADGGEIEMVDQSRIPLARRKRKAFQLIMENYERTGMFEWKEDDEIL